VFLGIEPDMKNSFKLMHMKRSILIALFVIMIASIGCNNGAENTAASSDSAAKQDTIKADPSTFSDPH
jgi:hypothetical protein